MNKKVWENAEVTELGVKMTEVGGKKPVEIDNIFFNTKGEVFASFKS